MLVIIVCKTFWKLDGRKAPIDLSSYAVRFLKVTYVDFYVEHYLRTTQRSRKMVFFVEISWKFHC